MAAVVGVEVLLDPPRGPGTAAAGRADEDVRHYEATLCMVSCLITH